MVMKYVWSSDIHRERIRHESSTENFVRFINLLLNDTTFLLDESLSKLAEIHSVQEKMKDEAAWNALPEVRILKREKRKPSVTFACFGFQNERKEIEESHSSNEKRCQSLLFLAKETLFMVCLFFCHFRSLL